jgi:hypothetical protein
MSHRRVGQLKSCSCLVVPLAADQRQKLAMSRRVMAEGPELISLSRQNQRDECLEQNSSYTVGRRRLGSQYAAVTAAGTAAVTAVGIQPR